jgi:hypothetical protein
LPFPKRRSIKSLNGPSKMPSRTIIVRTLGIALVSLLLCAVLATELPELLSLTDNSANDFTMCGVYRLGRPVLCTAMNVRKSAVKFNIATPDWLFGPLGLTERAETADSRLSVLYSVLRT